MTKYALKHALMIALAAVLPAPGIAAAQAGTDAVVTPVRAYRSTPARLPIRGDPAALLQALPGFSVTVFARDLGAPRMLAVSEDGTVYVTRRDSNDVLAIRDSAGTGGAARKVVVNAPRVHGIALHDRKIYLATVNEIYAADLLPDGRVGSLRPIVTDLPSGGQHPNRTLGFGPDGMLYVSVGSTCNVCVEPDAEHATILRMRPDGTSRGVYARGLRNTLGFAWQGAHLWGFDHGSDWMGNDTPPEELNLIQPAADYGWPYCYARRTPNRYFSQEPTGSSKDELCPRTTAPALTYQAHSAPIQMAFYIGSAFPAEYRDDAFVAMRGSWNRQPPTGYKVVRVSFEDGRPVAISDFLTGFLQSNGYIGRPAGLAFARDGSLLVSDDTGGFIYRVSAQSPSAAEATR
jgi:glucose/arabinose dehydrogenase